MEKEKLNCLNELNRAIIRFRNLYSCWATKNGISYHEMLVCYAIREFGFCTQKIICESYLLPKQTINNVFLKLRKNGILVQDNDAKKGKEKVFILSEKGKAYYRQIIMKLDAAESKAVDLIEFAKLRELEKLFSEYDRALSVAFGDNKQ